MKTALKLFVCGTALTCWTTGTVAHVPHHIEKNDQIIANGQQHPAFQNIDGLWTSCEGFGEPFGSVGPSWYGIETAHHGPDAGTAGRVDDCYAVPGGFHPGSVDADRNPAID